MFVGDPERSREILINVGKIISVKIRVKSQNIGADLNLTEFHSIQAKVLIKDDIALEYQKSISLVRNKSHKSISTLPCNTQL